MTPSRSNSHPRRRSFRPPDLRLLAALAATAALFVGCTDASLYSSTRAKAQANRVALEGRVCTEDPREARFPVRTILLVDQAAVPVYGSDYDTGGNRFRVLRKFVRRTLAVPETEMAVVGYGGTPEKLAPEEEAFTDDRAELADGIRRLRQARGCDDDEACRDYLDALRLARTLIEGDLAGKSAGRRMTTHYAVVMLNGGAQDPLPDPSECCDPQADSCDIEPHVCQTQLGADRVEDLDRTVREMGGGGFRMHAIQMAAYANYLENGGPERDDRVQASMEAMASAGDGTFRRFDDGNGLDARALDVLELRTQLQAKSLIVSNRNAVATPSGQRVDSDADGLPDAREESIGTDPTVADTDGDGITDLVEQLTDFDPTSEDDPDACRNLDPGADSDLDGLTDCDERLLGTEPSLVDSDGDAMPDPLEVKHGTNYLRRDASADNDGDGVDNGDEIRRRLDPRSTDTDLHLSEGYRYDVVDQGFDTDLFVEELDAINGASITDVGEGTRPGLASLRFRAEPPRFAWRDPGDQQFGDDVEIDGKGRYELPAASHDPARDEQGRRLIAEIDPARLPPHDVTLSLDVRARTRQCYEYDLRNVQLMRTLRTGTRRPAGYNDIVLYFAQSPVGDLRRPSLYRRAQIPVRFDPPDVRRPSAPVLEVEDRAFVRPDIDAPPSRQ